MKITFFIGSITGGGAEHVICEMASYFSKKGYECEILTVTRTKQRYYVTENVRVISLDDRIIAVKNGKLKILFKICSLYSFIRRSNANCYIIFLPETIYTFLLFRKLIKEPIIVSERNNPTSYPSIWQKRMITSFSKADGVVFQTKNAFNYYHKRINNMPSSIIIPNAILGELPDIHTREKIKKNIVSVGRFNEQKNFPLLIKAFSVFVLEHQEYNLLIYGDGKLRDDYMTLIEQLGLANKVLLPGFIDNIPKAIQDCEIFVLSSDYEGIPNALMEAMAMGLPCIATQFDGGAAEMLIEDHVNGLIVPKNDVDKLANAIKELVENPELAKNIGYRAVSIREKLAKEKVFSKWEEFINNVCENYK